MAYHDSATGFDHEPLVHYGRHPLLSWMPALLRRTANTVRGPGLADTLRLQLTTLLHRQAANNSVTVGRGFRARRFRITVTGSGNRVEIGDNVNWSGTIEVRGHNLVVRIGDRCDAKGVKIVAWDKSVLIGSDCLFAKGVEIRSSDIHSVFDRRTGHRLNEPEEVTVGNHVWVAAEVVILKGSRIEAGSIVGTRSVVTGGFDKPNSLIVGNPARLVRSNIAWRR